MTMALMVGWGQGKSAMNSGNSAILIPCYNAQSYLADLLQCVRSQTMPFAEVACYDDASTDGTAEVASALGVQVLRGAVNGGAAVARNRLIEASRSPWVHFHDADDLLLPAFLERMAAEAGADVGAVICNIRVEDMASGQLLNSVDYSELATTIDPVDYFLQHVCFMSNGLYSREWLTRIGGFREDIRCNEDPDLHVRLAAAGCRFRVIPEPLVTKREHANSFFANVAISRPQCAIDKIKCLESYVHLLNAKYRRQIGRAAIQVASGLSLLTCAERDEWVARGLRLAEACGVQGVGSDSPIKEMVGRIVGIRNVMRYRVLRNRLARRQAPPRQ